MNRRGLMIRGGAFAALLAAGAAWQFRWFGTYYAPSQYDDLLDQIADREPAAKLGAVVLQSRPNVTARGLATQLRASGPFQARVQRDLAQNQMTEVDRWLLPESVALYAALAAAV